MKEFEGVFWHASVSESNRHGTKIQFTSVGSDGFFQVPESRIESVLFRLEVGEDPDIIAQSLPVDEPPAKRGRPEGFSPINGVGGSMIKKQKAWSMSVEDWVWLESQENQSEVLRELIKKERHRHH